MPAVLFLRSKRRFDVPAGSRIPVAARDPIIGGQWLGRAPGPDATWGLALRIRPGFFTRHPMDRDVGSLARTILVGIEDVIDPGVNTGKRSLHWGLLRCKPSMFAACSAALTIHTATHSVVVGGCGTKPGQLLGPSGVAIAPSETAYVTNSGQQDVVAYDPNGHLRATWGSWGDGQGQFNGPSGIAVGTHGTVYVSDTLNQRIEAFSPSGTFEGQLATPWPGSLRVLTSGGLPVTNQMTGQPQIVQFPTEAKSLPAPADVTALAVNPNGGYAVATRHGQVMVYGAASQWIRTWIIPPAYGNRVLPTITALAWSGQTLYVVDGRYHRILAIHTALNAVPIQVTALGLIDHHTITVLPIAATALLGPQSAATQANGNLVIADPDRQRILKVNPASGSMMLNLAIHDGPYGVASLSDGRLLVTGYYGDTLTELSAAGSVMWRTGSPGGGATQLNHPTTVIALANHDIAVWDTAHHRAVIFSPQGTATQWIDAPANATAPSVLPSGALLWATPHGLVPTAP